MQFLAAIAASVALAAWPAVPGAAARAGDRVVVASAAGARAAHADDGSTDARRPVVATHLVGRGPVSAAIEIDATMQAVRQSVVAAQVSGSIVQRLVRPGDFVRAGEALVRIDARDTQAALAGSEAAVARTEAEAGEAQAAFERSRQLVDRGYTSRAALDAAQARLQAAQASRAQARAARTQAALARHHATVTAPYDARVLATHVEDGDLAVPGRPVVTLYALQPMRAVAHVPASLRDAAREATRTEVRLASGEAIVPVATALLPGVDPVSQTFEVRLELPASTRADLVPGRSVRVRFESAARQRLTVPAESVLRRGELDAVYVARGDTFVLRAVRLGASHAEGIEVLAGLAAGERIAADPVRAGLRDAVPAEPDAGPR